MRTVSANAVAFTKTEIKSVLDRFLQAVVSKELTPSHRKNLSLVYGYLITNKSSTISINVFENFLNVLSELNIPEPDLNKHFRRNLYNGSYYDIPKKSKDLKRHNEKTRIWNRHVATTWQQTCDMHGIMDEQVLVFLEATSAPDDVEPSDDLRARVTYLEQEVERLKRIIGENPVRLAISNGG